MPTHWPFYYCPRRDIVYSKEAEALEWNLYHRVNIRGRRGREPLFRKSFITVPNAPEDKFRCTISPHGDIGAQVRLTGWCTSLQTPIQQLPTTFSDLLIKKQGKHWEIHNIQGATESKWQYFVEGLIEGTAKVVSDGSFFEDRAFSTSTTILQAPLMGGPIIISNIVPGRGQDQSAFRAELGGIYASMRILKWICKFFHLQDQHSVQYRCDGLNALSACFTNKGGPRTNHFDLIDGIQSTTASLPLQIHWGHVKGHQDRRRGDSLDEYAQMNILADSYAKEYNLIMYRHGNTKHTIKGSGWNVIRHDGFPIVTKLRRTITTEKSTKELLKYWASKRIPARVVPEVHLQVLNHAMKASTVGRRRFVSKFTSGWIGTQSKLAKWHNRISDTCPRCREHKEDTQHVIVCKDPSATLKWFQHIRQLHKWVLKQDVEPDIASTLCQSLNSWKLGLDPLWRIRPSHSCYRAVLQQSYIGWFNLLGGMIGTEWVRKQEMYYSNKNSKISSVVLWSTITRKL